MKESKSSFAVYRRVTVTKATTILIAFLILGSPVVLGQAAVATLSGTVIDPNGQAVPGTAVAIANPATGFKLQTTTNDDGIYSFPNLTPGTYTVTARREGFATAENREVVLNVNDKRSLQIQLQVGDVNAVVQVAGESSLVDDSPAVATTVDRQFVENLPLNGRSFQGLIALSPGVVTTGTGLEDQGQFSVNGQRTASNSFYVDGVSANFGGVSGGGASLGQFASGALPSFSAQGGTNSLVSVDAVQEFTIQTSTYAPEFGRTPGAQVSILTRGGTNKFTGSVFEYFRDDALDANDWFANRSRLPKPPLRVNNYGGVIGGPVYFPRVGDGGGPAFYSGKDRTFFFFSYEAQPFTLPQTRLTHVPTVAFRQAAPAGLRPFLNSYPLPNGPVLANQPLLAEFNAVFADRSDLNTYSIRIDHNLTSRFQIFGRFSDSSSNRSERAGASVPASNVRVSDFKTRTLTLGNTWSISNAFVNDLRVNYSTHKVTSLVRLDDFGGAVPVSAAAFFTTPQPFTEENSFFTFNLIGGNNLIQNFGKGQTNEQRQLNIVDNLSFVKGSHSFKFGGDYRRLSPIYAPREYQAVTAHLNPAAVLADTPLLNIIQADRSGEFFFNNFGLYGQDTWKVSPRMTLTYGLRWDVDFAPTFGGGLQPLAATTAGFDDPTKLNLAPEGTPIYETTYNNFAPRVGIAYQIRQKAGQETVLRGGFGVFYDLASQGVGQQIRLGTPPFGNQRLIIGPATPPIFPLPPDQAALPAIGRFPPFVSLPLFDPELKLPYTLQWNLAVEQSLGSNQSFTATYVAAAGRRLLRQRLVSGNVIPPGAATPLFTNPSLIDNTAESDYHSMQLQFQRRLSQGLQALASYTWGHSIDTSSTGQASIADARLNFNNVDADRGDSNFDVRHTFNAAVSYEIPAPFENTVLRAVLGGWALDNVFTSRSAPPVTPVSTAGTFSSAGAVLRLDRVPTVPLYLFGDQFPGGKALNPAAFSSPPLAGGIVIRQGTLGRNSVRGFGAWQLDTSLRRQFRFTERFKLQFRADFFNIFNHPNFGQPTTNFQSATFGRSTNMLGRSLGGGSLAGGFNPLFQIGGPRSTQLSVKFLF